MPKPHRPMVYAGEGCSKVGAHRLEELGWGQCCSEGPWRTQKLPFFLDNGAFKAWTDGLPFPEVTFLRRVQRCYDRGFKPDFVVLPDVVADAQATFELSARWNAMLPEEWPKYLVLQDGMQAWQVGQFAGRYRVAGLFLGGTDWFKNNHAQRWCDFARTYGLKFHYARAGTPRKFEHAILVGADSLDSTRLTRSGKEWSDFARCKRIWLQGGHPRLFKKEGAHA